MFCKKALYLYKKHAYTYIKFLLKNTIFGKNFSNVFMHDFQPAYINKCC